MALALTLGGVGVAHADEEGGESTPVSGVSAAVPLNESPRVAEWQRLKFGMFVHWGVYSELGGYFKGKKQRIGYPEQIKAWAPVSDEEYLEVAKGMTIENFDPDAWCQLAKDAGMKYLLITSKHHDGFAMWDTATTDYNIVKKTAFGKDPMPLLAKACRDRGVGLAFYFSIIDWTQHEPEPWQNLNPIPEEMMPYIKAQLTELLTKYGPIAELWFDMGAPTADQSERMAQWVHELQPNTLVNSRVWNDKGDFEVGGDNQLRYSFAQAPWESIYSTFPACWGYCSWPNQEAIRKDPARLVPEIRKNLQYLLRTNAYDGQFLLNVGPKGDGSIDPFETSVLEGIGEWNARHPAVLGDTRPTRYPVPRWGEVFAAADALYLTVREWTPGGEITIPGAARNVTGVAVDAAGAPGVELTWRAQGDDLVITLPEEAPDPILPVLRVSTAGEPEYVPATTVYSEDGTFAVGQVQVSDIASPTRFGGTTAHQAWVAPRGRSVTDVTVKVGGRFHRTNVRWLLTLAGRTVEATTAQLQEGVGGFALPSDRVSMIELRLKDPAYYAESTDARSLTFEVSGTPVEATADIETPESGATIVMKPGESTRVTFSGVVPGDRLRVELHSDPLLLDEVEVTEDMGSEVVRTVTVPEGVSAGEHHLVALRNGRALATAPLTVVLPPPSDEPGETVDPDVDAHPQPDGAGAVTPTRTVTPGNGDGLPVTGTEVLPVLAAAAALTLAGAGTLALRRRR